MLKKEGGISETYFFIGFASLIIVALIFFIIFAVVKGAEEDKILEKFGANNDRGFLERVSGVLTNKDVEDVKSENTPDSDGDGLVDIKPSLDPSGDIDNDEVLNIDDIDIDGDGQLNSEDSFISNESDGGEVQNQFNVSQDNSSASSSVKNVTNASQNNTPQNFSIGEEKKLLVYYPFNETTGAIVYDFSGNGYNGVHQGNAYRIDGYIDKAYDFKGSNYIKIEPAPRITNQQFTIEAWVKPSILDWTETIFYTPSKKKYDSNGKSYYSGDSAILRFHGYSNDCLSAYLFPVGWGNTAPISSKKCGSYWLDGHWHHVALTYDNITLRLYVEGNLEASKDMPGVSFPETIGFMNIGSEITGPNVYGFKGAIDEVKYWNYAKTDFGIVNSSTLQVSSKFPGIINEVKL